MEKSNKRGKIPQSDWPTIMARYEAGETLASIAKTYDCSPPAISYIVSRSRARNENGAGSPVVTEPQLIKTHLHNPAEAPAEGLSPAASSTQNEAPANVALPPIAQDPPLPRVQHDVANLGGSNGLFANRSNGADRGAGEHDSGFPGLPPAAQRPVSSGATQSASPQSADQRRTLHLEFGNGSANHPNGAAAPVPPRGDRNGRDVTASDPLPEVRGDIVANPDSHPLPRPQQRAGERPTATPPRPYDQPRDGYPQPSHSHRSDAPSKDSGAYIDQDLRARVDSDIAAFLSAFDAALALDTQDNRSALREATDRLLRAGARTRIELERLEARVPLPPRDSATRAEPAWRSR